MQTQIDRFEKNIRKRLRNFDGPQEAADDLRAEYEENGFILDGPMLADLAEAVSRLNAEEKPVKYLRRNSIICERTDWYCGPSNNDKHWPALSNYLEFAKKWNGDTVRSIDETSTEIVSYLGDPSKDDFSCRGLVVGFVQSGKTANMTAVIAKAVDAGYNLIIVLGGVTNKLRAQTQRRLEKDVVARHRIFWEALTTPEDDGDFSLPTNRAFTMPKDDGAQFIVMKKEGSRLRALRKTIDKTPQVVKDKLKVLIIDDECDQASVNSAKGEFDMTKINEAIREVLARFKAVSYVGYTATPFANVFIDPYPNNPDNLDDLYPKDFITSLPRPIGYFGTSDVFGTSDADSGEKDMVRLLTQGEEDRLRPTSMKEKESFRPELTENLRNAVLWFLATCAIRRLRGHADQHMSMLVHSSQFVMQHRYMAELLKSWLDAEVSDLVAGKGDVAGRFGDLIEYERTRTFREGHDSIPETLQEIRSELPNVLEALEFAVENGESDMRLDYENGPKTYIAIGGTVLARGLTLEGLAVSFFLRTSKQYDTLLQMGRWFGYRPDYDDLPRLWTTDDLVSKFRSLATIEEEIRDDIANYQEHNLTPVDFAVRIRAIPGMAITSASKMKHALRTSMSYEGEHVQTIRFDHKTADVVRGNWRVAADLIETAMAQGKRNVDKDYLFHDVPIEAVRRYLRETHISEHHMTLKQQHLLDYLDKMETTLASWNVAVLNPNTKTTSSKELGPLGHVNTFRRSRLKDGPDGYADIKALMSKRDILIDVEDPAAASAGKPDSWNAYKNLRPAIPLLVIYPIDAASPEKEGSTTRVPLDATDDLIGFGIVFPGLKDRSGGYFQVDLDAPSQDQLEEEIDAVAEVEGT